MDSDYDSGRRRVLKGSLAALSAGVVGSAMPWNALMAAENPSDINKYKPIFFSQNEWRFLLAACDRLIPQSDDGPSAVEANVPIFIDWQMENEFGHATDWYMQGPHYPDAPLEFGIQGSLPPRQYYRRSIKAIDVYCQKHARRLFADLSESSQTDLLEKLEDDQLELGDDAVSGRQFFSFLLQNTKEGYFADPMYGGNKNMAAWKMIGFPGARASYFAWAEHSGKPYPLGPVSIKGERG